jgi:hypothetical protein
MPRHCPIAHPRTTLPPTFFSAFLYLFVPLCFSVVPQARDDSVMENNEADYDYIKMTCANARVNYFILDWRLNINRRKKSKNK